jgi:hypothetical protein
MKFGSKIHPRLKILIEFQFLVTLTQLLQLWWDKGKIDRILNMYSMRKMYSCALYPVKKKRGGGSPVQNPTYIFMVLQQLLHW